MTTIYDARAAESLGNLDAKTQGDGKPADQVSQDRLRPGEREIQFGSLKIITSFRGTKVIRDGFEIRSDTLALAALVNEILGQQGLAIPEARPKPDKVEEGANPLPESSNVWQSGPRGTKPADQVVL